MSTKHEPNITATTIELEDYPVVTLRVRLLCDATSEPVHIPVRLLSPDVPPDQYIAEARKLLLLSLETLIKELKTQ